MNNRLVKLLIDSNLGGGKSIGIDLYNHTWFNDIHPTITTRSIESNNYFIKEDMNEDIKTKVAYTLDEGKWARMQEQMINTEPKVLGWTRDKKGNVVNRHPVSVANAVTAAKRDNTQNYVVEPINTTEDGLATTLTTAHHYSGNIVNPQRGQTEMGVAEKSEQSFRIRKLTPRECFRLMGCDESTIDTLESAGISNSQLYKLAGNSIVVDVLAAIFDKMIVNTKAEKHQQMLLF